MDKLKFHLVSCFLISVFLLAGCKMIKPNSISENSDLEIVVELVSLSALESTLYELKENSIKVWKDGEIIYKSKILLEDWSNVIANKNALSGLKVYYDSNVMDGFVWKVVIRRNGGIQFLYLNNVCFDQTNSLFASINDLLPIGVERILIKDDCQNSK